MPTIDPIPDGLPTWWWVTAVVAFGLLSGIYLVELSRYYRDQKAKPDGHDEGFGMRFPEWGILGVAFTTMLVGAVTLVPALMQSTAAERDWAKEMTAKAEDHWEVQLLRSDIDTERSALSGQAAISGGSNDVRDCLINSVDDGSIAMTCNGSPPPLR